MYPWHDTDFTEFGETVPGVDSLSNVEKSLLKRQRDREFESVQLSQMEKERILLNKEALMNTLKRKLNELFKDNLKFRKDYLRFRLKQTEENGKGGMLRLLFMKLADSLNPRKCSSIWQTNGLIRLKGKRAVYLENKIREIELLRKIARNIVTKCGTTKNLLCGETDRA